MPDRDSDDDEDRPARKKKSRRAEDDEDDRPKKNRKGGKKAAKGGLTRGQKQLVILGGAGLAVLLVVLVAAGIFLVPLLFAKPDKTMAGVGWYEAHEEPNYAVTAYFPGGKPTYEKGGMNIPDGLAKMSGSSGSELSWNIKTWEATHKGREYAVVLFTFPSKGSSPGMMEEAVLRQRMPDAKGVAKTEETCTLGGKPARRITTQGSGKTNISVLAATGDSQMLNVSVSGPGQFDHTDPLAAAFFDNVTVK